MVTNLCTHTEPRAVYTIIIIHTHPTLKLGVFSSSVLIEEESILFLPSPSPPSPGSDPGPWRGGVSRGECYSVWRWILRGKQTPPSSSTSFDRYLCHTYNVPQHNHNNITTELNSVYVPLSVLSVRWIERFKGHRVVVLAVGVQLVGVV